MNRKQRILVAIAVIVVAAGSFALTWATRAAAAAPAPTTASATSNSTEALLGWLDVSADTRKEIATHDAGFDEALKRLRSELQMRREELAAALEDAQSSDQDIRQRVEAVISASAAVERRVTEHLLSVRDHLTPDQQKRLFGLCAAGARQGPGWRWRQGGGGNGPGPHGPGMGQGPGGGWRRGRQ